MHVHDLGPRVHRRYDENREERGKDVVEVSEAKVELRGTGINPKVRVIEFVPRVIKVKLLKSRSTERTFRALGVLRAAEMKVVWKEFPFSVNRLLCNVAPVMDLPSPHRNPKDRVNEEEEYSQAHNPTQICQRINQRI